MTNIKQYKKKCSSSIKRKSQKSHKSNRSKSQKGGSPASKLVMEATTDMPVMNDYISSPRIRDSNSSNMAGGGTSGSGSGLASSMVMSQLTDDAKTVEYPKGFNVTGDMNSLNLYAPSGGSRRKGNKGNKKNSKSHKKNSKSYKVQKGSKGKKNKSRKNSKSRKNNHTMRGGYGSAWIASQYSLGNINNQMGSVGDFSASQGVDRNTLMNPPTMGLAGSGSPMSSLEGANVRSVGSPLV